MASDSIVLKLTLDALGAKEKASDIVKELDGFAKSLEMLGVKMEHTLGGRLTKGVLGTFKSQFSNMMNEDLPEAVRGAKLQQALTVSLVSAVNEGIGKGVQAAMDAMPKSLAERSAVGAFGLAEALTFGGRIPFPSGQEGLKLYGSLHENVLARETAAETNRAAINSAQNEYFNAHTAARPKAITLQQAQASARGIRGTVQGAGRSFLPDFIENLLFGNEP